MALTDAVVRQARITGKGYTLNDAEGLLLFVTGKGAKKWHFRFTWLRQQQRMVIGSYPALSLKQAREQRDELRAQVARGVDPRRPRRRPWLRPRTRSRRSSRPGGPSRR